MNTAPIFTTTEPNCTAALARTLLADGWTHDRDSRTEPVQDTEIHELASPDGRLRLAAARYADGRMTARLSARPGSSGPVHSPGWEADLHKVSLPVALAAVKAAADPAEPDLDAATQHARSFGHHIGPHLVAALLTARGWEVETEPEEDRDGRITEIEWVWPDGRRSVCWSVDDRLGTASWSVTRWHSDGRAHHPTDTYASEHTPPAVIAALALSD
ncbi:hypothetical protein KDK95_30290 [Actinospica sp. MGRD01-02]|uniref:DUF317 domain-containing protein n=1 Tax=Actinospica acidithermotolerans TaxID=2828514 RepID=A0A941EDB1_9ACTN|nr:hypothetical protein [Actinospica acidithermotolerans]MBR7830630.1 hypothetical protein [Actinospica acidithermotolerans]